MNKKYLSLRTCYSELVNLSQDNQLYPRLISNHSSGAQSSQLHDEPFILRDQAFLSDKHAFLLQEQTSFTNNSLVNAYQSKPYTAGADRSPSTIPSFQRLSGLKRYVWLCALGFTRIISNDLLKSTI